MQRINDYYFECSATNNNQPMVKYKIPATHQDNVNKRHALVRFIQSKLRGNARKWSFLCLGIQDVENIGASKLNWNYST